MADNRIIKTLPSRKPVVPTLDDVYTLFRRLYPDARFDLWINHPTKIFIDPPYVDIVARNESVHHTLVNRQYSRIQKAFAKAYPDMYVRILRPYSPRQMDYLNPEDTLYLGEDNALLENIFEALIKDYRPSEVEGTWSGICYIFGPAGIGKTHLIKIFKRKIERAREAKVLFFKMRGFYKYLRDRFYAPWESSLQEVLKCDYLILDDFSAKGVDDELLWLFRYVLDRRWSRVTVITSRHDPKNMRKLPPGLASRLMSGFYFPLKKYEMTVQLSILYHHYPHACRFPAEVLGALVKMPTPRDMLKATEYYLKHPEVPPQDLRAAVGLERDDPPWELVLRKVCGRYRVEFEQLVENTKKRQYSEPRQMVFYLMRHYLKMSYKRIHHFFPNHKVSTIRSACSRFQRKMEKSDALRRRWDSLVEELEGHLNLNIPISKKVRGLEYRTDSLDEVFEEGDSFEGLKIGGEGFSSEVGGFVEGDSSSEFVEGDGSGEELGGEVDSAGGEGFSSEVGGFVEGDSSSEFVGADGSGEGETGFFVLEEDPPELEGVRREHFPKLFTTPAEELAELREHSPFRVYPPGWGKGGKGFTSEEEELKQLAEEWRIKWEKVEFKMEEDEELIDFMRNLKRENEPGEGRLYEDVALKLYLQELEASLEEDEEKLPELRALQKEIYDMLELGDALKNERALSLYLEKLEKLKWGERKESVDEGEGEEESRVVENEAQMSFGWEEDEEGGGGMGGGSSLEGEDGERDGVE